MYNNEKRKPNLSVSIEQSIADKYKLLCANKDLKPSNEIRKIIITFINDEVFRKNTIKKYNQLNDIRKTINNNIEPKIPQISVSLENGYSEKFKELCKINNISVSKILRMFIERSLEDER